MHIVIIGNGITGITAARHIRKQSDCQITVISGETDHFFSRTALMYIYMGHMRYEDTKPYEDWFWEKNHINLMKGWVTTINFSGKSLELDNGRAVSYDKLIIACGSKSNKFGWPGQDLNGVQGLYSYQDLEALEQLTPSIKHAVIVGGGLIGIELAEMLHSRHIPVTLLVREENYWSNVLPEGESKLVNRHIREHGFDLRLSTELRSILDDGNGNVRAVQTNSGAEIECQFVGLTAGVSPNIEWLKETELNTDRGIIVNHYLETNLPGVYAAGDCAQFSEAIPGRRPIEQVWYTGRMQAEVLARTVCGQRTPYDPGPWFNSAKFLDIEYQTYGVVMPKLREGERSLYWEHADGKKCVHLVYHSVSKAFVGINTFGIRYRHQLFDRFLREERDVEYVLENLGAANFDPEFYEEYETSVVETYNRQNPGANLQLNAKRGFAGFLSLIRN